MARTANPDRPSEAKLLASLRRTKGGRTASQLHTTSAHLRSIEGVIEVGRVRTGKAGRPAIVFGVQGVHDALAEAAETDEDRAEQAASAGEAE